MSDADSLCWSSLKRPVSDGQYFSPFGKDTCEKCKCLAGKAVGCFFEKCPQLPNCGQYKQVEGTCCDFECLGDNGFSDKTELSVLLSLGTGLALLLIILILVLYCRRQGMKKEQNEMRKTQTDQSQSTTTTTTTTAPSPEASAESSQEERVKLPPPYSCEPRCLNGGGIKTPPNEPPPPYVDREESAV